MAGGQTPNMTLCYLKLGFKKKKKWSLFYISGPFNMFLMSICQKKKEEATSRLSNKEGKADKKENKHTQPGNKTNPKLGYDY